MSETPVILTCAVTGGEPFNRSYPDYPITPEQIAATSVEAAKAGASVVHVHVRDPENGDGSRDPALFRDVVARIRDSGVDIVLNLTAGMGAAFYPDPGDESRGAEGTDMASVDGRMGHVEELRPELCTLDVTTLNQSVYGEEFVYLNTQRTLREMARRIRAAGVKPELEVFHAGDIVFAKQLIEEGLIDRLPLFQFVLGVRWGAPADPETMMYMRGQLPDDAIWAGFGIGRQQMPMVAQAALLGGNARVGLEDNLYLERGVFARNGQLVERARTIIECLGKRVATPEEARKILGVQRAG